MLSIYENDIYNRQYLHPYPSVNRVSDSSSQLLVGESPPQLQNIVRYSCIITCTKDPPFHHSYYQLVVVAILLIVFPYQGELLSVNSDHGEIL